MNDATNSLLVTPKVAARMLAVSVRKLWSLTFEETPGVPYVRIGRLVRYARADLERWIAMQRRGDGSPGGRVEGEGAAGGR
jgi:predicted DNA-binding transcriptional regulator AlpA